MLIYLCIGFTARTKAATSGTGRVALHLLFLVKTWSIPCTFVSAIPLHLRLPNNYTYPGTNILFFNPLVATNSVTRTTRNPTVSPSTIITLTTTIPTVHVTTLIMKEALYNVHTQRQCTFHDQVEHAALEANHHVERSNIFAFEGLPPLGGALGSGIPFKKAQHAVASEQRFVLSSEEVADLNVRCAERERLRALGILSRKLYLSEEYLSHLCHQGMGGIIGWG